MKILLVPDRKGWALDRLVKHLTTYYGDKYDFTSRTLMSDGFDAWFTKYHSSYDIVHFMANRAFHRYCFRTVRPQIFTLNHVDGGWDGVDRNIRFADVLCVSSDQWIHRVKQRYGFTGEMVKRIFFGVETDIMVPSSTCNYEYKKTHGIPHNSLIFGFSVAKSKRKGVDKMWSCLRELRDRISNPFIVRITGNGWRRDDIPDDMKGNAVLEGMLPDSDMPSFFASLDFYVCTSDAEGGPYPVMESMSCGITVLSTRVGVTPELVEHGVNGFFLDRNCLERSFVHNVALVADSPEKRKLMGDAARETVVRQHAVRTAMERSCYDDVYMAAHENYARHNLRRKIVKYAYSKIGRVPGNIAENIRNFIE